MSRIFGLIWKHVICPWGLLRFSFLIDFKANVLETIHDVDSSS